jgi:hypothetical protein
MTTLKKLEDCLHRLETKITKAQSEKSGSALTNNHLRCFGTIVTPVISQLQLCPDPDPHFDEVKAEVRKLAQGLINLYLLKNKDADEVNEIQPLTFDFFEKTCQLYFPDIWKNGQLSLANKKKDDDRDVSYRVNLFDDDGNCYPVKGETDSTLFYQGVPVGVWEDKNFNFQLSECGAVAQAFAEVYYSAREISNVSQQLRLCSGILTSGLKWTLMIKSCLKGNILHNRTIPISLIDTSQTPPIETNVDYVTKLVLFHLQVIQSNIQLIDTSLSKISSRARIEKDEDEDIEDNQEDDDGTEPRKKKKKTGPHDANQSRGGGRSGGGRRGDGKQGRGYANLQLQSSNSLLTLENVYKFNLSQPIFILKSINSRPMT